MAASVTESGVELIARLGTKVSLVGRLDPAMFPKGPHPRDVIEVYGEGGSGKSQYFLHLVATCILPEQWKNVPLGGLGVEVVYIDTTYDLNLLRLSMLLEAWISNAFIQYEKHKSEVEDRGAEKVLASAEETEDFVKTCLSSLYIVKCSSSHQLVATLHSLESLLGNQPEIGVVFLDSISAYYWIDKCAGGDSLVAQETNIKHISSILLKLVHTYNLVLFAAKCALFQKRKQKDALDTGNKRCASPSTTVTPRPVGAVMEHYEFMSKMWARIVTQRLIFSKDIGDTKTPETFHCWFDSNTSSCRRFTIQEHGIVFHAN